MRKVLAGCVLVAASCAAQAQEGFPLDGTWRGERKATGAEPVTVVIVMEWDGKQVKGVVNPGPNALQIVDVKLTPEGWRVNGAATTKAGQQATFEGAIEDLASYHRTIVGKWTEGGKTYDFRLSRE